ncbi:MAG: transcriptional regulator [Deinococcales bacterium]|nr:transcriptional regulator [Deinococcales bacterium]
MSVAGDEAPAAAPSARALVALDRLVHEPARLAILTVLAEAEEVEFRFLESVTGLTKGNISSHVAKLEAADYVTVTKRFQGRKPVTSYRITATGRAALDAYRAALSELVRPPT